MQEKARKQVQQHRQMLQQQAQCDGDGSESNGHNTHSTSSYGNNVFNFGAHFFPEKGAYQTVNVHRGLDSLKQCCVPLCVRRFVALIGFPSRPPHETLRPSCSRAYRRGSFPVNTNRCCRAVTWVIVVEKSKQNRRHSTGFARQMTYRALLKSLAIAGYEGCGRLCHVVVEGCTFLAVAAG